MIFLKDVNDLKNLLHSKRLFSKDPIIILIPEMHSGEVVAAESRINLLKREPTGLFPLKTALVTLAVVAGIVINQPGFYPYKLIELLPVMLGIATLAGIAGLFLSRFVIKIKLQHEVRQLLKQIHRLERSYEQKWVFE